MLELITNIKIICFDEVDDHRTIHTFKQVFMTCDFEELRTSISQLSPNIPLVCV